MIRSGRTYPMSPSGQARSGEPRSTSSGCPGEQTTEGKPGSARERDALTLVEMLPRATLAVASATPAWQRLGMEGGSLPFLLRFSEVIEAQGDGARGDGPPSKRPRWDDGSTLVTRVRQETTDDE